MYTDFVIAASMMIFWFLLPVLGILLLIKSIREYQASGSHSFYERLKRSSLGVAIAILLPLFLYFLVSALTPQTNYSSEASVFELSISLIFGLVAFLLGLLARRVPVVGNGVSTGAFFYLLYVILTNFWTFSTITQLAVCLAGLLIVVGASYFIHFHDIEEGRETTPTLSGIKGFIVGFMTFFLANFVVVYAALFVSELAGVTVNSYGYSSGLGDTTRHFVTSLVLAIVFLILGMTVRAVKPVSSGLLATGILSLIFAIGMSFSEVGQLAATLTTGFALALLIGYGYYKFSHQIEVSPKAKK